jgi:hypothetical protein
MIALAYLSMPLQRNCNIQCLSPLGLFVLFMRLVSIFFLSLNFRCDIRLEIVDPLVPD